MTAGGTPKAGGAGGASGTIVSINVSRKKGQAKTSVPEAQVIAGEGIREDAHRGFGHRQVSLLMIESIDEQAARLKGGPETGIGPGAYAENLTTRGIDLKGLEVGDELLVRAKDGNVRLRVSQIGKECHTKCAIYKIAGDCIMPGLGIFCEVVEGGTVRAGDRIEKR
jgi:MOSC domain-containing protein YiiM